MDINGVILGLGIGRDRGLEPDLLRNPGPKSPIYTEPSVGVRGLARPLEVGHRIRPSLAPRVRDPDVTSPSVPTFRCSAGASVVESHPGLDGNADGDRDVLVVIPVAEGIEADLIGAVEVLVAELEGKGVDPAGRVI